MQHPETNDLWQKFVSGDDNALSDLYDCYVHELFSYGLKIHGDEFLVKDSIQEVFIHLIDHRKKLTITDTTHVYLFKSLRNKLLEEVRSTNRRNEISRTISLDDTNNELSAEQVIIFSEEEQSRTRIMNAALNTLSDYQREALFFKYSQGFEYEKIAELLNIDIASTRTLIYRSLKKVKETIFRPISLLFFLFCSTIR